MTGSPPNALARTLRQFFADHLPRVRGLSRHTIHSYRDTLLFLLRVLATARGQHVTALDLADITAEDGLAFLDYVEQERHNTASTRHAPGFFSLRRRARAGATGPLAPDPADPV